MQAYFVSDVHLKDMASPSGEALLRLLKKAQQDADLFVILGDLFDLWVGPGSCFQDTFEPLLHELRVLRKTCRVIYFEGNHDLHLEGYWKEVLNCEVYTGPYQFKYGKLRIWAEHGDEINQEDHGYLFLRRFLRSGPMRWLINTVPSEVIQFIGTRASSTSRKYSAVKDNPALKVFRAYAQKTMAIKPFDLMVVGHSHVYDDFQFEGGRLVNLGSWFDGPKYMTVSSEGNIEIHSEDTN